LLRGLPSRFDRFSSMDDCDLGFRPISFHQHFGRVLYRMPLKGDWAHLGKCGAEMDCWKRGIHVNVSLGGWIAKCWIRCLAGLLSIIGVKLSLCDL
jgi:hypothetical protein